MGALAHDDRCARVARTRRRAQPLRAARPNVRRTAVEDSRRARPDDARELRRLPAGGEDAAAARDPRRPARALRERLRRGQGRRLQQRPHAGDRARQHARHRALHDRGRYLAQGEPRRALSPVRLSEPRRRELPRALGDPLGGRGAAAFDHARAHDEVDAGRAEVLMRRLVLLLVVLLLAACGGGSKQASGPELTPVAFVKSSAAKTAKATSEHLAMTGSVTVSGQSVALNGKGDFDNTKRTGALHVDFNAGGLAGTIDEVIDGTVVYMKSPLFADALPKGKTWIKIDLQKAGASKGIDFSTL